MTRAILLGDLCGVAFELPFGAPRFTACDTANGPVRALSGVGR